MKKVLKVAVLQKFAYIMPKIKFKNIQEHFFGITGQICSGFPLLIITWIISNMYNLEQAGEFTILIGFSSTLFALAMWGFRPLIVINKHNYTKNLILLTRIFLILLASIIILLFSIYFDYNIQFAFIIIFIKFSDLIIDLNFGYLQIHNALIALRQFSVLHFTKLLVLFFICFYCYYFNVKSLFGLLILATFIILVLNFIFHIKSFNINFSIKSFRLKEAYSILLKSLVFLSATIFCAILTNIPRFTIDFFADGDLLGVIGITLSVCTFFGMTFNTNWQRHFSDHSNSDLKKTSVKFIIENFLITIILMIVSYFILPLVVSKIFNFSYETYRILMLYIFSSYIIFNFGMSTANLFKFTSKKIYETFVYIAAISFMLFTTTFYSKILEIYHILFFSGLIMFLFSLISIKLIDER